MKRPSWTKRRNPLARAVKRLRPKVIRPKRGKGSYRRKSRHSRQAGSPDALAGPADKA